LAVLNDYLSALWSLILTSADGCCVELLVTESLLCHF